MAPNTPQRSVKYLKFTLKSTPCSGHTKKINSALALNPSVASPLSLAKKHRRSTTWNSMMILYLRKRRKKLIKKCKNEGAKADP